MKTVKISDTTYKAVKAYAKGRGLLLQYVLNVAIGDYLRTKQKEEKAA